MKCGNIQMLNIPEKISEVYNRIVADFKTYNKNAQPAVKNRSEEAHV